MPNGTIFWSTEGRSGLYDTRTQSQRLADLGALYLIPIIALIIAYGAKLDLRDIARLFRRIEVVQIGSDQETFTAGLSDEEALPRRPDHA